MSAAATSALCAQGLVKLADFGVAAKLGELEERRDELTGGGGGGGGGGGHGVMAAAAAPAVVGTPYWMAPEVRGGWGWGLTVIQSRKESVALQGETAAAHASFCTSP